MGGECDAEISAETPDEMIEKGMAHLEIAHPKMAADVKATPEDDPIMVAWGEKFAKEWEAAPEAK